MPTYEYACKDCGQHLEVVQSFSDDPLTVCPNCGGTVRKVFAPVGIVLKGSGFYKNDSRSSGKRSAPSTTDGDAAGSKAPETKEPSSNGKETGPSTPKSGDGGGGGPTATPATASSGSKAPESS